MACDKIIGSMTRLMAELFCRGVASVLDAEECFSTVNVWIDQNTGTIGLVFHDAETEESRISVRLSIVEAKLLANVLLCVADNVKASDEDLGD
jgi:hypothetical protein